MSGSLFVVGTGIRAGTQITPEARAAIGGADVVHYLVADALTENAIQDLAKQARSLTELYSPTQDRRASYEAMVERILDDVRAGLDVCAAFYGHPGVFVDPSHAAIDRARREGFRAEMVPGISAADALYADLGVDPADYGCLQMTATEMLIRSRKLDPTVALILWQIGAVGEARGVTQATTEHLPVVVEYLTDPYPAEHEVVLYEASGLPGYPPQIERLPLSKLAEGSIGAATTLFMPPVARAALDEDMVRRLGLTPDQLSQ